MTWGGGRSEIHKQLIVNNDQSSPELLLLLFRKHLQGDMYQSLLGFPAKRKNRFAKFSQNRKYENFAKKNMRKFREKTRKFRKKNKTKISRKIRNYAKKHKSFA